MLRLSFVYGMPPRDILKTFDSRDLLELQAADLIGLLPDPWQQTGVLAQVMAAVMGGVDLPPETFKPGGAVKSVDEQQRIVARAARSKTNRLN